MHEDAATERGFRHQRVALGDVSLHVVEVGEGNDRPLVVLLHGFPEFWWSWRHQLAALASAGFHAIAPDMRGYNLSDQPRAVKAYRLEALMTDVAGLIRAFGAGRAVVVGHDWGAAIAWQFAQHYPGMVSKLVILNVPHPRRMLAGLRTWKQLKKSWYILFFQLPWLPEWSLRHHDFRNLRRLFARDGFAEEELEPYVNAARSGTALRSGINYYRASLREMALGRGLKSKRIEAPTLIIWGERDQFLGKELAIPDSRWVPNAKVEFLPAASHWVQQSAADRVNQLLLEFLSKAQTPAQSVPVSSARA